MFKHFYKADLRSGMHVVTRDGGEYLVITGYDYVQSDNSDLIFIDLDNVKRYFSFNGGDDYNDDLTIVDSESVSGHAPDDEYDIMQVYEPNSPDCMKSVFSDPGKYNLIYRRDNTDDKISLPEVMQQLADITKTITDMYKRYADERPAED